MQLTLDMVPIPELKTEDKVNKEPQIIDAPKSDSSKLTYHFRYTQKNIELYKMLKEIAPDIVNIFPELSGQILSVRFGELNTCSACWQYDRDEIVFSTVDSTKWTIPLLAEVLAHETTHALCSKTHLVPHGEKATDLFMISRLPIKYLKSISNTYLECNIKLAQTHPVLVQSLANQAIALRNNGLRNYIKWFEEQINQFKKLC